MEAYNVNETCRRAGISRTTFYKLLQQGEGPVSVQIGRRRVVLKEDFESWMRELRSGETIQ